MSGPITNTRTMESSLLDAIQRLKGFKQTARTKKMIAKAERYLRVVSQWGVDPPNPEDEYTVIPEVLLLLKACITYSEPPVSEPDPELPVVDVSTPDPTPRASVAASSDTELRKTVPGIGGDAIARLAMEKIPAGMTAPAGAAGSPPLVQVAKGVSVVRPERAFWQPFEGRVGVSVKQLRGPGTPALCCALVRLAPGAELPTRQHGASQELYVLSGVVQIGEMEVHAGEFIRAEPQAVMGVLRSPAECTLLLVGAEE